MGEEIKCKDNHTWNGVVPVVDSTLIQVQNKELIGEPCDCGSVVYNEEKCGCSIPIWEIVYSDNRSN